MSFVLGNPVKNNDPSGHDVGCAGYDASRCSGYNTLSEETKEKQQYDIPPVVDYINTQIKKNSQSEAVAEISAMNQASQSNSNLGVQVASKVSALSTWASLVGTGKVWDQKSDIRNSEANANRDPDWQQAGSRKYHFDTWSNIHYGYVGKVADFSDSELLQGAGLAQLAQNASKREPLLTNPGATGFSAFDAPEDQAATFGTKIVMI